jgi:phage N-6-adenine-methyltransferase
MSHNHIEEAALPGRHVPAQKPGQSEQVVVTPDCFMRAVEARFGPVSFDLAATQSNSKSGKQYYGPGSTLGENSLEQDWSTLVGICWLNPPYGRTLEARNGLEDWTAKAAAATISGHDCILILCPASVGSNWFVKNVWGKAKVYLLNGRITFEGHASPYPKDLMLLCYGVAPGVDVWRWRWE